MLSWTPLRGAATPLGGYHYRSMKEIAMDALNVTQIGAGSACRVFFGTADSSVELEKISCWFGRFSTANPFEFFGKRVLLAEQTSFHYADDRGFVERPVVYSAKVLAVHVGSLEDGIETSLLLKRDGSDDADYAPVSRLMVLQVLE